MVVVTGGQGGGTHFLYCQILNNETTKSKLAKNQQLSFSTRDWSGPGLALIVSCRTETGQGRQFLALPMLKYGYFDELRNQRENRQGRQNPNVQNDKTALRPVPTPAPALNIAIMLMMIAQAMQGKQAISQEQIRMQTERQPETGLTCILKGNFEVLEIPVKLKTMVAKTFLVGKAEKWWKSVAPALTKNNQETERMSVVEYTTQFSALGQYVLAIMEDDYLNMLKFEEGLLPGTRKLLSAVESKDYYEAYKISIRKVPKLRSRIPLRTRQTESHILSSSNQCDTSTNKTIRNVRRRKCPICDNFHSGECRKVLGTCFQCGQAGHNIKDYPHLPPEKAKPIEQPPKANARVFSLMDIRRERLPKMGKKLGEEKKIGVQRIRKVAFRDVKRVLKKTYFREEWKLHKDPSYRGEKYKKTKLKLEQNTRKSSLFWTQQTLASTATTDGKARPTVRGRSLFSSALCSTEPTMTNMHYQIPPYLSVACPQATQTKQAKQRN
ncbi:hypothetical protein M9H77_17662 [Catharanthus roseus]|uniref:Uncharacterized protein n=1 Tax=Catharanthus roseus TaxID=4058 RepID=A0ACC0B5A2_CATRO|nr:hypothetical protein M9H77_17662 [Catharanthus roseus]